MHLLFNKKYMIFLLQETLYSTMYSSQLNKYCLKLNTYDWVLLPLKYFQTAKYMVEENLHTRERKRKNKYSIIITVDRKGFGNLYMHSSEAEAFLVLYKYKNNLERRR